MDERRSDHLTWRHTIGAAVIGIPVLALLVFYLNPRYTDQNFACTVTLSSARVFAAQTMLAVQSISCSMQRLL
jgi:hypothetical protein